MKTRLFWAFALLLMCMTSIASAGDRSATLLDKESHEERVEKRAERVAKYQKLIDSLVEARSFQFNPQTMQRQPAGQMHQIVNPHFDITIWNGTADITLPYIKGYVAPYYVTMINFTVTDIDPIMVEQTHNGWMVTFSSSLYSSGDYKFTFEIYSSTGGANLTITNPWYNPVQYFGTISQVY